VRIVARLHRSAARGGDADLAVFTSPSRGLCFAVVAGAPRCTADRGCAALCADEWSDSDGRAVLAGLAPLDAAAVRAVLDDGTTIETSLDGPLVGAFPGRRRVFMLDLGKRRYRRLELLDTSGRLVARRRRDSA
jgi:hypothetical protein